VLGGRRAGWADASTVWLAQGSQLTVLLTGASVEARVEEITAAEKETLGGPARGHVRRLREGCRSARAPFRSPKPGRVARDPWWANDGMIEAVGKVAGERPMSVSALFEDLLACEVGRFDRHGGKSGVDVRK
jgi:hypothetical protein